MQESTGQDSHEEDENGSEEEAPQFEITFTAALEYGTHFDIEEDEFSSLEEFRAHLEEMYETTDFADYQQVLDSDRSYKPMNEAARRLLARWKQREEEASGS